MNIHRLFSRAALLLGVALLGNLPVMADTVVSADLPLAVRFCRSEMLRHPDYKTIDSNTALKWNYTHGLLCQAIFATYDCYQSDTLDCSDLYDYAKGYYEATITAKGVIYKYSKSNYSLDHVNPGKNLFRLYTETGDERYKIAMETLRDQLQDQPRTSEGGFWHKNSYPYQMWLDGIYMGEPYYARYAKEFESDPSESYADVIRQFLLIAKHTKDDHSGLYRHGWDEKCQQVWADPTTGQSSHVWGRALGWYTMALVDVLEILPEETPDRDSLLIVLQGIFDILPQYQDPVTGAWYQVTDYPDSTDNYTEMSCTPMFAYSIVKGIRLGYLDPSLMEVARKAYEGILDNYLTVEADGKITLEKICSVAGLSDDRDGSYDYYVHQTTTVSNDPKGVGPFILLCVELEKVAEATAHVSAPAATKSALRLLPQGNGTLLTYSLQDPSDVQFTCTALSGKTVYQAAWPTESAGEHRHTIDTAGWPAGLYIAQLKSKSETMTVKYIKK
ncbi:MAG: glycoside hydrolase family 88 protein [Porphyromonadaceae bacterium]|nr:glycoside hydrolase family 88 protein [Porphyromonadaceae bacterium]